MQQRKFSREFKLEAVKLVRDRGVSSAEWRRTGLYKPSMYLAMSRAASARVKKVVR